MDTLLNLKTVGAACSAGFLAYCVYFDYKRRNASDYHDKVRARRERERKKREMQDEIELPPVEDKAAIERFFIREIEIGEQLIQEGEIERAVKHLSYAVVLCPQPQQMLQYMREMLPSNGYTKLVENLTVANKRVTDAYKRSYIVQDDDVE